jgi:aminoglycoside phosphotransferase (APT) family kinase protein
MQHEHIDKPVAVRANELLNVQQLRHWLAAFIPDLHDDFQIEQFSGGYSNLTYLLTSGSTELVLRKPPFGVSIKSAHDMGREFNVLKALKPVYPSVPTPIVYCDDVDVIGSPFYIMERVKGVILRNRVPKGMSIGSDNWQALSEAAVDNLASLHAINVNSTGLINMGRPEGYVKRQVQGWTKRYVDAETDVIVEMNAAAEWLTSNMPEDDGPAFIHNDYKYDNLVLHPSDLSHILAVLDWEMATVGSPLMDLGTTLAYWAEAGDSEALKPFNLTWLEGNLTREQVLERYRLNTGRDVRDFLFYYVFGSFKIAVIVQQIYARYKKGLTSDPRFATLGYVVKACAENASKAIRFNRISHFY